MPRRGRGGGMSLHTRYVDGPQGSPPRSSGSPSRLGCLAAMHERCAQARGRVAGLDWWHTIEVAPGVVTPGWWDLRPTAERLPWPGPLDGLRCLDVGTLDGFWAFELERRGAREVVAIDIVDPGQQDSPFRERPGRAGPGGRGRGETFRAAAEQLGSAASYRDLSVYDLDPALVGKFDLVAMGYVLQMLRDPLRGLEAVRRVCRGRLLLLETVSLPLSALPAPLARLSARRGHSEWFVFNRRGLARALDLTGFEVEATTPVLRDRPGPAVAAAGLAPGTRAKHTLGLLGWSAALRARALP
jgi:tRNA (mo5U34)-methyltransferase